MTPHRTPILTHIAAAFLLILILCPSPTFTKQPAESGIPCIQIPVSSPKNFPRASLDWNRAARIQFHDFWSQKTHSLEPTEVFLLNTGASLRIKFLCEDSNIRSAPGRQHDGETFRDDCVEVFFARPEPRIDEGYGLEINATGTLADMRVWNPQKLDFSWNSGATLVENLAADVAAKDIRFTLQRTTRLLAHGGRHATGQGWILEIDFPWTWLRRELALPESSTPHPAQIRANFARWNHGADGKIFTIWSDPGLSVPKPHAPSRYGWLLLE
ncbi:carbohydrate-binding family 9-like protein [Geminisphaera colitermitum]|uniref:carbohydrate-binding family 9-like protein n=1 Tax=Geminisphaera colitermitum TaxID=1148786 RepID=UPI000158C520|nr:carbohydrate-binding family 9-like protein [Geminisphaera colitermitum]